MNIPILSKALANRRARNAVANLNLQDLQNALASGADPNVGLGRADNASLLLTATRSNWPQGMQCLVEHGADMEDRSGNAYRTPLFEAVANYRPDMARVLLAAGASVDGKGVLQGPEKLEQRLSGKDLSAQPGFEDMFETRTARSVMEYRAKTDPMWQDLLNEAQNGTVAPAPFAGTRLQVAP